MLEVAAQLRLGFLRQRDAPEAQLPATLAGRADAAVELHAAHRGQVVALLREEQAVEQRLYRVLRRRLAGPHHAVDRDARGIHVRGLVRAQRLGEIGALVEVETADMNAARVRS